MNSLNSKYTAPPLNPWKREENGSLYHSNFLNDIENRVDQAPTSLLPDRVKQFAIDALFALLTRQHTQNSEAVTEYESRHGESHQLWQSALEGSATPNQIVTLVNETNSKGMDIGRAVRPAQWDMSEDIDRPVITALVNDKTLETRLVNERRCYKLKQDNEIASIIETKQVEATHFGDPERHEEKLWTLKRQIILLDKKRALRDRSNLGAVALEAIENIIASSGNLERKWQTRTSELSNALDPILQAPIDRRPKWLIHQMTNYYTRPATTSNL